MLHSKNRMKLAQENIEENFAQDSKARVSMIIGNTSIEQEDRE